MGDGEVRYGASDCLRCKGPATRHRIESCAIDQATADAVSLYISTTKALAGQRTKNREIMRQARVGATNQLIVDESAERLIGALHAQTTTGVEYKLVSASGQNELTARVRGWEVVDPKVPDRSTGDWIDIYGRKFVMAALPGNLKYSVPCAAVKLLLALGQRNTKHLRFNWIHIYEEKCAGVLENGKRSSALRQWHGKGKTYTYAAHSCEHCVVRLPMLLCDRGGSVAQSCVTSSFFITMPKYFRVSDIRWSDLTPGQRELGASTRQMVSVEAECRTCNYPFTASVTNRWLTAAGSGAVVMCPQCNSTEMIEGRP